MASNVRNSKLSAQWGVLYGDRTTMSQFVFKEIEIFRVYMFVGPVPFSTILAVLIEQIIEEK